MKAEVIGWSVLPEPRSSPFFSGWGQLRTIMNPSRSSNPTLTLRSHRATTASTTSSSLGHNPGRGHDKEWPKGSGKSMSTAHTRPQEVEVKLGIRAKLGSQSFSLCKPP